MSPISQDLGIDMGALSGITQDSRRVQSNYLFAALSGEASDGREFIDDALERGASIVLSDESTEVRGGAQFIQIGNPRKAFSHLVSEFYKNQPSSIVAITGTNGKSSVVYFIDQFWKALGYESDYIGTLSGSLTTPDPETLHEKLADMVDQKIDHVALEASSHGLEQHRIDGVAVQVAGFTSFSQDHLDYHNNMESYLQAKSRLFGDILPADGVAVLNADSSAYDKILAVCDARGIRTISYGENGDDITLVSTRIEGMSQSVSVDILGDRHNFSLPLIGHFQVMNVLCAMGCVMAQDSGHISELVKIASGLRSVPGRLEHVKNDDGSLHAYVDYAHTPDALENVLLALRPYVEERLICVFGCGGDRDKDKRPLMGEIASRLADEVIVTDDNPRGENPADIRSEIIKDVQDRVTEIAGRQEAIQYAVDLMNEKDVLLVAGKGHEQGQIFDGVVKPFDDVTEVSKALRNIA